MLLVELREGICILVPHREGVKLQLNEEGITRIDHMSMQFSATLKYISATSKYK